MIEKKYELTDETMTIKGKVLHRIRALKLFVSEVGVINIGDLGGWIEKEENLSHNGSCWIYDDAKVYDYARVHGNAKIFGEAEVFDFAKISGVAHISQYAKIFGNSLVTDDAIVRGKAKIHGEAYITGSARIDDNAEICDEAQVRGFSTIKGNAKISQNQVVEDATCTVDLSTNLKESIRCQTGLIPVNGKVLVYKQVRKDLTSFYDSKFQYKIGEWAEVEDPEWSDRSCAAGLHFSNANYWNYAVEDDTAYLIAEINLEDIITVQKGKIRCERAFIIGRYEIEQSEKENLIE